MVGPRLVIVIPAHNEAQTIADVTKTAVSYGKVVVVDDCSSDLTAAIAKTSGAIVIQNKERLGYECSLERGFKYAESCKAQAVVTLDADGEHNPDQIETFRKLLFDEHVQLVIGRRKKYQRWTEYILNGFVLFCYGAHDILCGMKGYHMSLYAKNGGFDHYQAAGAELAISGLMDRCVFKELNISGEDRKGPPRYGGNFHANLKILHALWRIVLMQVCKKDYPHIFKSMF